MKAEVTLEGGRVVTVDVNAVSLLEFRKAVDPASLEEESDGIVAKACGMKLKDFQALGFTDFRRVTLEFFRLARAPLGGTDPKGEASASEPTST